MKSNRRRKSLYSNILIFLLTIYTIVDLRTSDNFGIRDSDRTIVYIVLGLFILWLLVYMVTRKLLIKKSSSKFVSSMLHISIWIILVNLITRADFWISSIHVMMSFLWIVLFLVISNIQIRNDSLRKEQFKNKFILLLFLYLIAFVYAYSNLSEISNANPVLNLAYYLLVFVPLTISLENKNIRLLLLILISVAVLVSAKRGAILIFPLMIIFAFSTKKLSLKKILYSTIFILGFAVILISINNFLGGFIFERFGFTELIDGSGRIDIYNNILNEIKNSTLLEIFMGHGSGSSIETVGTGAHNEWIEFLFSFGIIGLILYAKFLFHFIRFFRDDKKGGKSSIVYVILISLFGGFYFTYSAIYIFTYMGIKEGSSLNEEENRHSNVS